jgi:hypothetical protein
MGAVASAFKGLLPPSPMDILNDPRKALGHALAPHRGFSPLGDFERKLENNIFGYSPLDNLSGTAKEEFVGDPNGNDFLETVDPRAFQGTQEEKTSSKKIKRASGPDRRRANKSSNIFSLMDDDYSGTLLGGK